LIAKARFNLKFTHGANLHALCRYADKMSMHTQLRFMARLICV